MGVCKQTVLLDDFGDQVQAVLRGRCNLLKVRALISFGNDIGPQPLGRIKRVCHRLDL